MSVAFTQTSFTDGGLCAEPCNLVRFAELIDMTGKLHSKSSALRESPKHMIPAGLSA